VELRKDGDIQGAVNRINQGIDKARLDALRVEQATLRGLVEREREAALRRADRRRWLTILAVLAGAVIAVLTVSFATRILWRRVGAPLGDLLRGDARQNVSCAARRETDPETHRFGRITLRHRCC
jgi:anti-sigma factor RsiW